MLIQDKRKLTGSILVALLILATALVTLTTVTAVRDSGASEQPSSEERVKPDNTAPARVMKSPGEVMLRVEKLMG